MFQGSRIGLWTFCPVLACFLDTAAFRCLWIVYRIEKDSLTDKQHARWHTVALPETCSFLNLHLGRRPLVAQLVEKCGCVQEEGGEEGEEGAW
jgi:hypothetical protein